MEIQRGMRGYHKSRTFHKTNFDFLASALEFEDLWFFDFSTFRILLPLFDFSDFSTFAATLRLFGLFDFSSFAATFRLFWLFEFCCHFSTFRTFRLFEFCCHFSTFLTFRVLLPLFDFSDFSTFRVLLPLFDFLTFRLFEFFSIVLTLDPECIRVVPQIYCTYMHVSSCIYIHLNHTHTQFRHTLTIIDIHVVHTSTYICICLHTLAHICIHKIHIDPLQWGHTYPFHKVLHSLWMSLTSMSLSHFLVEYIHKYDMSKLLKSCEWKTSFDN